MDSQLTSYKLLEQIFPQIEEQLIRIITKFGHNINQVIDTKSRKNQYLTPGFSSLLATFPRDYSIYHKCVSDFVNVGRSSPEDAISILLSLYPQSPDPTFYARIRGKIPIYESHAAIFDLLITLFFSDCLVQVLSADIDTPRFNPILEIGYYLSLPYPNAYESQMRVQIIRQFSVAFSIISIKHIKPILDGFKSKFQAADPTLFVLLHRFIRLAATADCPFAQIRDFIQQFDVIGNKLSSKSPFIETWALSLCPLISQLSPDGLAEMSEEMSHIFSLSMKKSKPRTSNNQFMRLCAIILLRDTSLNVSKFNEFYHKTLLKKPAKPHRVSAALISFLAVLRGTSFSRNASFWEWGDFNARDYPGIEVTQLNDPKQDQGSPESFTSDFFKFFVEVAAIETYPSEVAEILVNLAARDFNFFSKSTVPRLISTMTTQRCIIPLLSCLSTFVDPQRHFSEWAQQNPLNSEIRVSQMIAELFIQLKPVLFGIKLPKVEKASKEFFFEISDSSAFPVFSLPMNSSRMSDAMRKRIGASTVIVLRTLEDWDFKSDSDRFELSIDDSSVEAITEEESLKIKLLEFLPRCINPGDLSTFPLLDSVVSSSKAEAMFSIKVINQIFVANEDSRIVIYDAILDKLNMNSSSHEVFMYLQLIVKLMDLSLPPRIPKDRLAQFLTKSQAVSLCVFTTPNAEIRDLNLRFLERLHRLAIGNNLKALLHVTITEGSAPIIEAVRFRVCGDAFSEKPISFQDAASSRVENIFSFFYSELCSAVLVEKANQMLIICQNIVNGYQMKGHPADLDDRERAKFRNISILFSHLAACPPPESVLKLKGGAVCPIYVSFHKHPAVFLSQQLTQWNDKVSERLYALISMITNESPQRNDVIIELFRHVHWTALIQFLPMLTKYIQSIDSTKNQIQFFSVAQIFPLVCKNLDLPLVFKASDDCKASVAQFIHILELHFIELKINGSRRFEKIDEMNIQALNANINLASIYATICIQFYKVFNCSKDIPSEGPLRAPRNDEWLSSYSIESKRITLGFLINWCLLRDDETLSALGDLSLSALCAFLRVVSVFDKSYLMSPYLEEIIVNMETSDKPTLQYVLSNHFNDMIEAFVSHSYDAPSEISPLFFKAICLQFSKDEPGGTAALIGKISFSNQMGSVASEISSIAKIISSLSGLESISEYSPVTDADRQFNAFFVKNSGKFVTLSLFYLINPNFNIRYSAFRFLHRVAPILHSAFCPTSPEDTSEFLSKLESFAPPFYSSYVSITADLVVDLASIFAQKIPFISDQVIKEAFTHLTTSASGSYVSTSNRSLLLRIAAEFMNNVSLETPLKFPAQFTVYTPYSLVSSLLDIFPSIDTNSLSAYFALWKGLGSNPHNTDILMDFLIEASNSPINESSVKAVVVYFMSLDSSILAKVLDRLTFKCWFYSIQWQSESLPIAPSEQSVICVLKTLTELAQKNSQNILPYIHFIIHFSLIHFDWQPSILSELLLVIFWTFPSCPSSIVSVFLPPASLIWTDAFANEEMVKNIAQLKSAKKASTKITDFVAELSSFLRKTPENKKILHAWGKECVRWICGCGDLVLSSRSAEIFAEILSPLDSDSIDSFVQSFLSVSVIQPTSKTQFYLTSMLNLFEKSIDRFQDVEKFKPSMDLLYKIARPIVNCRDYPDLSAAAIAIVTKYMARNTLDSDSTFSLLYDLMPLVEQNRNTVFGALLSIFKQNMGDSNSIFSAEVVSVFLPFLFFAFAAIHNIHPYSISFTDEDISSVMRCGILLTEADSMQSSLHSIFLTAQVDPESISADEFVLGVASILCQNFLPSVIEASQLLISMAKAADSVLLGAIFTTVANFISVSHSEELCQAYSTIVQIAAVTPTKEGNSLIEAFLNTKREGFSAVKRRNIKEGPSQWMDIYSSLKQLKTILQDKGLPHGETELEQPISMVALETAIWNSEEGCHKRMSLNGVKVQPFAKSEERVRQAKSLRSRTEVSNIQVPDIPLDFFKYRSFLSEDSKAEMNE